MIKHELVRNPAHGVHPAEVCPATRRGAIPKYVRISGMLIGKLVTCTDFSGMVPINVRGA